MKNKIVLSILFLFAFVACEKKPVGFGVEGSPIRYETHAFSEKDVLAEVNGQTFTRSQILDKSPVLKDLAEQENEAVAGLAYLKVVERAGGQSPNGTVEILLPESKASLAAILNRFDARPTPELGLQFKGAEDVDVVARFKGEDIKRDELNLNHVVLQNIEQRRYHEIATQLNGQVSRILVSEAASAKKQDFQSFLEQEVFKGKTPAIVDRELFAYLDSIGFARSELSEEIKPRFVEALKMRKQQLMIEEYVASKILRGPIKVAFTAPQTKLMLNENWRPIAGFADAPVAVVAFSGVTCPDCADFAKHLSEVMEKYRGHLKLNWIHNFNTGDGIAKLMAEASLCVDAIKPGRAMEFMTAFAGQSSDVDESKFYSWAERNKLDASKLKSCLVEKSNDTLIDQHREYAARVGIVANPTIWVEGRILQGSISENQLDQLVLESIKTKGSSQLAAYWRRLKSWF